MSLLDPVGACFSLLSTFYFIKAARLAWVVGIAAILVNTLLYYQKGLYGQVGLEFVYFSMMLYGWILWDPERTARQDKPIQHLHRQHWVVFMVVQIVAIPALFFLLYTYTDTTVPIQDAVIVSLSLTAQFLLCHKVMECWGIWFIVDLLVAIVQFDKGIPYHAIVHLIYLGMAVTGHIHWQKLRRLALCVNRA